MRHLTESELVDLLDDTLAADRRAHLHGCAACQSQAASIESVLTLATEGRDAEVPEPSPLFWDHLSARVRTAIAEPAVAIWRNPTWWPAGAWAAALASIALAVAVSYSLLPGTHPAPPPAIGLSAPAAAERVLASADQPADDIEADEAWALVRSVADQIEWDDAHDAGIATRPDAAERMTLELSTQEQSELARLLHRELTRAGT